MQSTYVNFFYWYLFHLYMNEKNKKNRVHWKKTKTKKKTTDKAPKNRYYFFFCFLLFVLFRSRVQIFFFLQLFHIYVRTAQVFRSNSPIETKKMFFNQLNPNIDVKIFYWTVTIVSSAHTLYKWIERKILPCCWVAIQTINF